MYIILYRWSITLLFKKLIEDILNSFTLKIG